MKIVSFLTIALSLFSANSVYSYERILYQGKVACKITDIHDEPAYLNRGNKQRPRFYEKKDSIMQYNIKLSVTNQYNTSGGVGFVSNDKDKKIKLAYRVEATEGSGKIKIDTEENGQRTVKENAIKEGAYLEEKFYPAFNGEFSGLYLLEGNGSANFYEKNGIIEITSKIKSEWGHSGKSSKHKQKGTFFIDQNSGEFRYKMDATSNQWSSGHPWKVEEKTNCHNIK